MNKTIESLYMTIAQGVAAKIPQTPWKSVRYGFRAIRMMSEQSGYFIDQEGRPSDITFVLDSPADDAFAPLRTEMAKLHENGHAWYTATFTLTPDGAFKFDFDYDHLPAFDIIPEPSNWLDEFKNYPRPEMQAIIQDWIDGRNTDDREISRRLKALNPAQ